MTFLITGIAGFLGTNLSLRLLGSGHSVIGVDVSDRHDRLAASSLLTQTNFSFVQLDLSRQNLPAFARHLSGIVHLAALPHVDYSCYHPEETVSNNVNSLLPVLELAIQHDLPLLFTSSQECYGGTASRPYVESDALLPLSPYAATKIAGEAIIQSYVKSRGLQATTVRLANLYGAWQAPDRLIPRLTTQMLGGFKAEVEVGTARDYVYVEDVCEAIEALLLRSHNGETYNLSTGLARDNESIGEAISRLLRAPLPTRTCRRLEDGRGPYLASSPEKIAKTLGWSASTDFAQGLEATASWFVSHRDWLSRFTKHVSSARSGSCFLTDLGWLSQPETQVPR